MKEITSTDIPGVAMEKFEYYSSRFIGPKEYRNGNFIGYWKLENKLGDIFIVRQGVKPGFENEDLVYIFQFDKNGDSLGYAEMGQLLSQHNPYTYLYFIRAIQEQKGFAKNIIPILNELSVELFGKPLNSSSIIIEQVDKNNPDEFVDPLRSIFEDLIKHGKVKREPDGSFTFVREKLDTLKIK